MRYLKLNAPIWSGGKGKKIKVTKELDQAPLRDKVAENLFTLLTIEPNKNPSAQNPVPYQNRVFATLEDQKKLHKLKERLVLSDDETVQLGNDLFEFLNKTFTGEGFDAQSNDMIVALSEMIEECKNQDEEKAEKEYKENKDNKLVTVGDYYRGLGYDVIIEEPKEE